jgi:hypothetical protein
METCDRGRRDRAAHGRRPPALLERGDDEVGPYQSPMEDGMQHFHEWYRREMGAGRRAGPVAARSRRRVTPARAAPWLMLGAPSCSLMGVCVKLASRCTAPARSSVPLLVGVALMAAVLRWRGIAGARRCRRALLAQRQRHDRAVPVVLRHRRPAAGHRDDAELHVVGVDRAVPDRRRGAAGPARASTAGWSPPCCGLCRRGAGAAADDRTGQLWHGLAWACCRACWRPWPTCRSRRWAASASRASAWSSTSRPPAWWPAPAGGGTGGLNAHTVRGALLLLAIGVLATAAQWMMTRAYATGATLGIAALQYLGIVFAFGFGVWLFDDPVTHDVAGRHGAHRRRRRRRHPVARAARRPRRAAPTET